MILNCLIEISSNSARAFTSLLTLLSPNSSSYEWLWLWELPVIWLGNFTEGHMCLWEPIQTKASLYPTPAIRIPMYSGGGSLEIEGLGSKVRARIVDYSSISQPPVPIAVSPQPRCLGISLIFGLSEQWWDFKNVFRFLEMVLSL